MKNIKTDMSWKEGPFGVITKYTLKVKHYDDLYESFPTHRVLEHKETLSAEEIVEELKNRLFNQVKEDGIIPVTILIGVDNIVHCDCIFRLVGVRESCNGFIFEYSFDSTIS